MANRVFLIRSDAPDIHARPDEDDDDQNDLFDQEHVVGEAANEIPLLWIPLFRPLDLRTRVVEIAQGETVTVEAPIVETERALDQLSSALPLYRELFPEFTTLTRQADDLRAAIRSFDGRFVTTVWEEFEWLGDAQAFRATVRRQLDLLNTPRSDVEPIRQRLFERFRAPRTQQTLKREMLAAHSNLDARKGGPCLIGGSWLKLWPSDDRSPRT
jgi:hypothetical protein